MSKTVKLKEFNPENSPPIKKQRKHCAFSVNTVLDMRPFSLTLTSKRQEKNIKSFF